MKASLGLSAAAVIGLLLYACGTQNGKSGFNGDDGGQEAGDDASDDGSDSSSDINLLGNDSPTTASITIVPAAATLNAKGKGNPVTQQFVAYDANHNQLTANWSIDNVLVGTVDNSGLFTNPGAPGGTANITAQVGNSTATAQIAVDLALSENPGGVPQGTITQLNGGGNADSAFKWLYPFDKTVFPRGLASPVLQFGGTAPDAVWVHAQSASKTLTYDGYFGASSPGRVTWSAAAWQAITQSVGGADPLTVSVTKTSGGQVTGPIKETWSVAQGTLKGVVYYNSYNSTLGGNIGAELTIAPGGNATLLSGGGGKCTVCHTVSSDGSTMLASNNSYETGAKYDLKNAAAMSGTRTDYAFNFPAIYPDGSLALSTAGDRIGGMWGSIASQLFDVKTGLQVPATGFDGVVNHAATPAFSPDGKMIAFNDEDMASQNALAMMNFDVKTTTFSKLTTLATDTADNLLGWPSFIPDGKAIVYDNHVGQSTVGTQPNFGTWGGQRSDLKMVDIATKKVTPLDLLNGYLNGQPYLPFGMDDVQRDFEPTVLPLAVGGYYWVVFTSRRQYGNTINTVETGNYGDTTRKKLWVAAIDLNYTAGKDGSHPAFYLPGQEDVAGNMRGFWALPPCQQDGTSCTEGDECCNGFCRQVNGSDGGQVLTCVPPPSGCAHEYEKCVQDADCCGAQMGFRCINGYCAQPTAK
jgi:hypothetical protein